MSNFFSKQNNFIVFFVWCTLVVALVSGITLNAVLYSRGMIGDSDVYRRLWYAFLCFVMMSILFPIEKLFRIRFSLFLEISLPLFAFAALAGGTVFNIYGVFPGWDKVLHTLSGPLFAIVGFAFADLLLRDQPLGTRKVVTSVLFAFLFALAVGYLWEMFEYTVDSVIPGYNNQRWQASVLESYENGTYLVSDARGAGLHDTMWDMIVNCLGAFGFLLITLIALLKDPDRLKLFAIRLSDKKKQ